MRYMSALREDMYENHREKNFYSELRIFPYEQIVVVKVMTSGKRWTKRNKTALSFACSVTSALKLLKWSGTTVSQLMVLICQR